MNDTTTLLKVSLPKLLRRNQFSIMLFSHIRAIKLIRPVFSIDAAIDLFIDHYDIDRETVNVESLRDSYFKMQNEYIDYKKVKV
jgi:hypothetical protein